MTPYRDRPNYRDAYLRLLQRVEVTETGCWEVQTSITSSGHANVSITIRGKKKVISAHRLSYLYHKGRTRNHVLHLCDNKPCINPEHLYNGTRSRNMKDAVARGRIPKHTLFGKDRAEFQAARKALQATWPERVPF